MAEGKQPDSQSDIQRAGNISLIATQSIIHRK